MHKPESERESAGGTGCDLRAGRSIERRRSATSFCTWPEEGLDRCSPRTCDLSISIAPGGAPSGEKPGGLEPLRLGRQRCFLYQPVAPCYFLVQTASPSLSWDFSEQDCGLEKVRARLAPAEQVGFGCRNLCEHRQPQPQGAAVTCEPQQLQQR